MWARSVAAPVSSATAAASRRVVSASARPALPPAGVPRVPVVGPRGSVVPRGPPRDRLMGGDAMMRISFALALRRKLSECRTVVAVGDRRDQPPHPREHRRPRGLADALRECLTFVGDLLSFDQAAAHVARLDEPLPDVESDPRQKR